MTQPENAIADLAMRIRTIGIHTAKSLNEQNDIINQLNDMILDNRESIALLTTKILQTDKKLDSLKSYLDNDIKKDIDSIMDKQLKELEDKLDLKKSIKTMSSSVANMYAGLRKKKRKTKRRKRKRRRTRKKS